MQPWHGSFSLTPSRCAAQYYGEEALARLREAGEVVLNETGEALGAAELIAQAAGCQVIVSDRMTPGPAAVFERLPELVAFVRCAVDIRNVDVGAASHAGVLVTRASPGFIDSVAELIVGMMVDLARGITRRDARLPRRPRARGPHGPPAARQARSASSASATSARRLAVLGKALGMRLIVSDPYVRIAEREIRQADLGTLLVEADFVVVLAVATEETENLIGADELGWMKPTAFLINASRGNLIDEAALAAALRDGRIAGCAHGRRPRARPDAVARARPAAERDRDAPCRRPGARGGRPSGARDHAPGRRRSSPGKAPPGAVNPERATRLARLG